jgi:hypothetical protein
MVVLSLQMYVDLLAVACQWEAGGVRWSQHAGLMQTRDRCHAWMLQQVRVHDCVLAASSGLVRVLHLF